MARFTGDGIATELTLRREEYCFAVSALVRARAENGEWEQATKRAQVATRDPFTRQPPGASRSEGYPRPPWEPFASWQGRLGGDHYLVHAGRAEEHVARMTVETEDALVDVPIDAVTGAYVVALRGKRTRDHYFRFFDAGGSEIAAWGERKWHYRDAEFVSWRGEVRLQPRDSVRDHLLGIEDERLSLPPGWAFEPTREDVRRWRAFCRGKGVFVMMDTRITLRFPDGAEEEVWGDVSQPRWIPWARPGALVAIDWDEVAEDEMSDGAELGMLGAKKAAKQLGGPRPITYAEDLQRLLLVHRLIAALQQRPMA